MATRKRRVSLIHPALQANPGGTQQTYLLEIHEYGRQDNSDRIAEPGKGSSGQSPSSFGGGYLPSDKGNRLQGPAKGSSGIYDPYNRAVYEVVSPTLLASDYKHCKYVIEEF